MKEGALTDSSIRLKKTTKKRVEKLGDLSDTWDSLLNDMVDFIQEHEDEWWEDDEGEGEAS